MPLLPYTPWFSTDDEGVAYLEGRNDDSASDRGIRYQIGCPDTDSRDRLTTRLLPLGFDVVDNDVSDHEVVMTVRRDGAPTLATLRAARQSLDAAAEQHGCTYQVWATAFVAPSRLARLRSFIKR